MSTIEYCIANNLSVLATYHVQEVNISIHNDSVVVECIFVDISTADGCHIIFTDSSQGINESFNITKPNSTESIIKEYITLSVSGNYTVKAYDIVNGIIIDTPSVVYPNIVQYVSLSLAPSSTTATANSTSIGKFCYIGDYYYHVLYSVRCFPIIC